jgi:serine/threonine protein kinase
MVFLHSLKKVFYIGIFVIYFSDLKPANIFIAKKHVKIGDFGFAKKNVGGLKNHTAVGTPLYMPI